MASRNDNPSCRSIGRRVEVRIKHRKYQAYDLQQVVQAGEERQISAILVPLYGTIQVESVPSQALIFVNGEERGRTPSTLARLALDTPVRIRLVKDGWKSFEQTINWDDGTERRHRDINVKLETVRTDPPPVAPAAQPKQKRVRKKRRCRRRPARRTRRTVRRAPPRPEGLESSTS